MSKYETRFEKRSRFWTITAITCTALSFGIHLPDILQDDIRIQKYNEQVESQLESIGSDEYDGVTKLVLEDNFLGQNGHYTFDSVNAQEQHVTCNGEYGVSQNVAELAGEITCSTTIETQ